MNNLVLLVLCVMSVEIFMRTNYFVLVNLIIKVGKKSTYTLFSKNISDHWKEIIIPKYSMQIMYCSIKMLLILILIISIFVLTDKFFNGFLESTFSLSGILKSLLFTFGYAYIRKIKK